MTQMAQLSRKNQRVSNTVVNILHIVEIVLTEKRSRKKSTTVINSDSESSHETESQAGTAPKKNNKGLISVESFNGFWRLTSLKKIQVKKRVDADAVDDEGFLADINVASLSNDESRPQKEKKGQDVDHFFGPKYSKKGVDGKPRTYRDCTSCR